jgi:hypothetical protein
MANDLNFTLAQGIPNNPNSFEMVRCRTLLKNSKRVAGRQTINSSKPFLNDIKTSQLFSMEFNNTDSILKQGEGLMLFQIKDIKAVIDFKLFIDNTITPENGLGVNTALSFGIATHDLTQSDLLSDANNSNLNKNMEMLPIFISNLDEIGNPVDSFKTDKTYFANSFSTANPVIKEIKDMKQSLYGFSQHTLEGIYTTKTISSLCLFNSGTANIVQGRIRGHILFAS